MFVKRMFDLFCCVMAIPVFGPVIMLIALAIKLDDGGPVFFIQARRGRFGRPFRCYKFRTMADGEVTRVGRWLRATGLDELGQVINIWRGEMSVVGPRPLTEQDIARLQWQNFSFRWRMKPGMTGLAQLYVGHGARRSIACDRYYAHYQSLALDVKIVVLSFVINAIGKRRFNKLRRQLAGSSPLGSRVWGSQYS